MSVITGDIPTSDAASGLLLFCFYLVVLEFIIAIPLFFFVKNDFVAFFGIASFVTFVGFIIIGTTLNIHYNIDLLR
jgi:hypothetical protein